MKCKRCEGTGNIKIKSKLIKCSLCNGDGNMKNINPIWIKNGKKIKKRRIEKNLSLFFEAKRLGMDILKYADVENGNIENSFYL